MRARRYVCWMDELGPVARRCRWGWAYKVQDMENSSSGEGGEGCLEDSWGGLGFGTGKEEEDGQGVEEWDEAGLL